MIPTAPPALPIPVRATSAATTRAHLGTERRERHQRRREQRQGLVRFAVTSAAVLTGFALLAPTPVPYQEQSWTYQAEATVTGTVEPSTLAANEPSTPEVSTAFLSYAAQGLRVTLNQAADRAVADIAQDPSDQVSSAAMDAAEQELTEAVRRAGWPLPWEKIPEAGPPVDPRLLGGPDAALLSLHNQVTDRLEALTQAVQAWQDARAAEVERLRVEEEARKAAEEAARVAAEAAAKAAAAPAVKTPAPAPETVTQRLTRLMGQLPFTIEVKVTSCSGTPWAYVLGCYGVGESFVQVTEYGLTKPDCRLREVLAHEYRHYMQWRDGLITYDSAGDINVAWLEADADAWASKYGC
jgi:hypothetical protein